MTTIILNDKLETIKRTYADWYDPKSQILDRCHDKSKGETIHTHTIPANAAIHHYNYLGYLKHTYANHNHIVLSPDHFWYTILAEIAQHITSKSEQHRELFTRDPKGKIDIIVPCNDPEEPLRMNDIYNEIIGLIPVDTTLFLPHFSTTTEMAHLARLASFLETCSPYYNYMMLLCGHPSIELLGTKDDWALVVNSLTKLEHEFGRVGSKINEWINETVGPIAVGLHKADDPDWFKQMFTARRCGSGGQIEIDGWFSKLFMKQPKGLRELTNFSTHISQVPYKIMGHGEWKLCFALTHSNLNDKGQMIPEYSMIQVKKPNG